MKILLIVIGVIVLVVMAVLLYLAVAGADESNIMMRIRKKLKR